MPKIMFRCDSSKTIGTGHVARCFALAEVFERIGWDVIFCGEFEEPKWILELLTRIKGLKIESVKDALTSQLQYEVVVFDSYEFVSNEQNSLANYGNFIVSIVDEVSEKVNADLYVSSLPLEYLDRFNKVSNYLFGPEYALVRSEFLEFKNNSKNRFNRVSNPKVGIFSGGTARKELFDILLPQITPVLDGWDFKLFAKKEEVSDFLRDSAHLTIIEPSFKFYEQLSDVSLVIATASVSSWEFLCKGIPLSVYGIYENQRNTYKFLTNNGYAEGLGFTNNFENLKIDQKNLNNYKTNVLGNEFKIGMQKNIVDGFGPTRVCSEIINNLRKYI
jgi:spore coat polysaccharide biosynthesis predicted glycosyltransferase SpsG